MNKFMLKISTILLGAFMSIGAGVAMAGINDKAQKANAAESTSWTRVTDTNELISGGTFILGYEATAKSGVIVPMANTGSLSTSSAGFIFSGKAASSGNKETIDMKTFSADGASYIVTIGASSKVSGAVFIKLGNNYLGNTNTKNNCKLFTAEATTTSFTPTINANNVITFTISANTQYKLLKYNVQSPRFAVYASGQQDLVAYKKVEAESPKTFTLNSGDKLELIAGNSYNFEAFVDDVKVSNNDLTWAISEENFDDNLVLVEIGSDGELTTVCDEPDSVTGSFKITATHKTLTFADGTQLIASCLVTFKSTEPYLEIDKNELEMYAQGEASVTITVYNFSNEEMNVSITVNDGDTDLCSYEVQSTDKYNVKIITFKANKEGIVEYNITLSNSTQSLVTAVSILVNSDKLQTVNWTNTPTIELNQRQELTWDHLTGELTAVYTSDKTETISFSDCTVLVNNVEVTLPYIVKTTDTAINLKYDGIEVNGTATLKVTPLTLVAESTIQGYKKVTEELTDWTGTYLIGYEASATQLYVMKGEDAVSNYTASTIKDDIVEENSGLVPAIITKKGTTYSIKIGDNYIYQTSNANGLKTATTENSSNQISYNSSTKSVTIISGGAYLRFNPNSGQTRFRYFKSSSYSSQKAIQLYKYMDEMTYEVSDAIYDFVKTVSATFTCSSEHDLSSESLTNLQATLASEYTKLSDEDKSILKSANANEAGNFIEAFLSRYDYIVGKYDAISNVLERNVVTNVKSAFMFSRNAKRANSMLLVVALVGISLVSYGIYSLTKKKEEK